ncbi:MAG: leucyl aminopeptidase [Patescibacteria group bacterium]
MTRYSLLTSPRPCDGLIVPVFEDKGTVKAVHGMPAVFHPLFAVLSDLKDFQGKKGETTLLYREGSDIPRLMLIGLGKTKDMSVRRWKQAVGTGAIALQGKKAKNIAYVIPDEIAKLLGAEEAVRATVIAAEVAQYAFHEHKSDPSTHATSFSTVGLVGSFAGRQKVGLEKAIREGEIIARSMNFVRYLGNTPPSQMTPAVLAEEAKKIGQRNKKIRVRVLSRPEIEKLKMGCFLGVAGGSSKEPKFIILEYHGGSKGQKPTVLVGKGITFDSGGLSLKPGEYMCDMKFDMLGGATVLGSIQAAAELGIKKNIIGLIPTCENMPSGTAYRPDDILTAMNGKTVSVENTDAEGRLILADALCYASKYDPKEVIDLATLTGHCVVALGMERSGLFSPDERLAERLTKSSEDVGELLWRLPVGEEFSEAIKSDVADIKNTGGIGGPRYGGASIGAAFLQEFTTYPWAHIDMSSCYYKTPKPWIRIGANGFGVETMVEYLCS